MLPLKIKSNSLLMKENDRLMGSCACTPDATSKTPTFLLTQEWLPCKKLYPVFRKGQINIKIPTSTLNSSIQETMGLQGSKIRSTTGLWIPTINSISHSYPQFVFALDLPCNNPFSMNHFFISIILHLMDCKIRTYTFIDSGATNSHISDSFVSKHSFPQHQLPIPIPITADDLYLLDY